MKSKKIYFTVKRLLDVLLALIALIVLFIPGLIIAICIKIDSKGPIFFKQKRIGKNKTCFTIYKFRTMSVETPKEIPTDMLENAEVYITPLGKWLRKTSIDELPQIINILKGDMSIIGPRPVLCNQENLISKRDEYSANEIRPGLTGLAQINGRDELEDSIKAQLDGEYRKHCSPILDAKIFLKTIVKVIKQENVVEGKVKNGSEL